LRKEAEVSNVKVGRRSSGGSPFTPFPPSKTNWKYL